jgi:hypothetical protein
MHRQAVDAFDAAPADCGIETVHSAILGADGVQRARHAASALVENVRVDHGRRYVRVTEQLLHAALLSNVFRSLRYACAAAKREP